MLVNIHERHHQATIAIVIAALIAIMLGLMQAFG
jgi:hypothetical protein